MQVGKKTRRRKVLSEGQGRRTKTAPVLREGLKAVSQAEQGHLLRHVILYILDDSHL